jgi:hypothetical protein
MEFLVPTRRTSDVISLTLFIIHLVIKAETEYSQKYS